MLNQCISSIYFTCSEECEKVIDNIKLHLVM